MTVELPHPTGDAELDEAIAESLAEAPPFTDEQRARLGQLLGGGRR